MVLAVLLIRKLLLIAVMEPLADIADIAVIDKFGLPAYRAFNCLAHRLPPSGPFPY